MRKLAWALIVAAALGAAAAIALLLFLDRVIAANRERILGSASEAVGRPLDVARIGGSLRGGIGVRLDGVRIAELPEFGGGDLFVADSILMHVKLLPLLRRELVFERIDAERPQVQLVRNAGGVWNYAARGAKTAPPSAETTGRPKGEVSLPGIVLGNIAQGTVSIRDATVQPERVVEIKKIDLALSDVGAKTPIGFRLVAAVSSDAPNVRLTGQVGPLQGAPAIPLSCAGSLGPFGRLSIDGVHAQLRLLVGDTVYIDDLGGQSAGGMIMARGTYDLRGDRQSQLVGKITGLDLEALMQELQRGDEITGTADAEWELAAGVLLSAESLRGTAKIAVTEGGLTHYNLLQEAVNGFTGVPQLGQLVGANVKKKYRRLFSEELTRFRKLTASLRVADSEVRSDDLLLDANDYDVRAQGVAGFDGRLDAQSILRLSPQLTADVLADVKEAQVLLDADGRIALPVRWRGRGSQIRPEPDLGKLGAVLQQWIPHEAGRLLDKLKGLLQR